MKFTRRPKNFAEGKVYDWLISQGWNVTKRGWPDFFCWKSNSGNIQILIVEVKRRKHHRLRKDQSRVFSTLKSHRISVQMLTPDNLPHDPDLGGKGRVGRG